MISLNDIKENLKDKSNAWLRRAIKQHKKVVDAFQYPYFWSDEKEFKDFREKVLYMLVDQLKKMEAELAARRGRL